MNAPDRRPTLRGSDKSGNVRPADSRYLSKADQRKQAAYVKRVQKAEGERTADDG